MYETMAVVFDILYTYQVIDQYHHGLLGFWKKVLKSYVWFRLIHKALLDVYSLVCLNFFQSTSLRKKPIFNWSELLILRQNPKCLHVFRYKIVFCILKEKRVYAYA